VATMTAIMAPVVVAVVVVEMIGAHSAAAPVVGEEEDVVAAVVGTFGRLLRPIRGEVGAIGRRLRHQPRGAMVVVVGDDPPASAQPGWAGRY
jgi:hypothetical protein